VSGRRTPKEVDVTEPVVEKPDIPREYGNPTQRLAWEDVERRLEIASVYWIASTRPDGRPHVVPRDGLWLDGGLYYGGSPETVHYRNVMHNPHVAVHIGDGQEAIIVEGAIEIEKPTETAAARLSDASFAKYPQYERLDPGVYLGGVAVLRPRRVLAWTSFTENATRFRFE
jgi:nitroimidazol reductase NimA-like FMN-containing flavoprotein (pyridoxamine 5'-phosphate oxidase superfamily)